MAENGLVKREHIQYSERRGRESSLILVVKSEGGGEDDEVVDTAGRRAVRRWRKKNWGYCWEKSSQKAKGGDIQRVGGADGGVQQWQEEKRVIEGGCKEVKERRQ
jgi:hypothetical protein